MIECVLADRDEVVKLAVPPPLSIVEPISAFPSEKFTVPVGVPDPGATTATVAVKVTACPATLGLAEVVSVVVVDPWVTVWASKPELLAEKFVSPL